MDKTEKNFRLPTPQERVNSSIEFSSDFIISYPGETEQDFNDTVQLIKKIILCSNGSAKMEGFVKIAISMYISIFVSHLLNCLQFTFYVCKFYC